MLTPLRFLFAYLARLILSLRYRSKWVSGNTWVDFTYDPKKNPKGAYRLLERAKDASAYSVIH